MTQLDTKITFTSDAQAEIESAFASRPRIPPPDDDDLHRFMLEECDFSTEHADGSFLEHLHFCRDYGALHLRAYGHRSPRVLLLHSICGVGTNCFPMRAEQLPELAALLDADEYAQVTAFPTVLRLLVHGPLLAELAAADAPRLRSLTALRCHRLLDNEPMELSAAQLWEQLNYQLVHSIDFLPAASWQRTSNEFFLHIFDELHGLLSKAHELRADVTRDAAKPDAAGARPPTWRHWAVDQLPDRLVRKLAAKQVASYSAALGHSLDYELIY
jgi:hypothetical protein